MISIGIVGASGYTGEELIRLLLKHPEASIDVLTSRTYAGKCVDDIYSFDKKLDKLTSLHSIVRSINFL